MIKEQRVGVFLLIGIIFIIEMFIHRSFLFSNILVEETLPVHLVKEIEYFNTNNEKNVESNKNLKLFNPNDCTLEDWQHIGFSKKQAEIILKYKSMLGGTFSSKEQIKSCFVISDEKYNELSPFLLLPEKQNIDNGVAFSNNKKYQLKKIDPNIYEIKDWMNIGFSEKQAEIILKYKNIVGGKFVSKDQIKKCFVISDSKYQELEPFMVFFENKIETNLDKKDNLVSEEKKELNAASFKDIISIIENEVITKRILGFRKGLGGFVSKEQLKDVYDIPPEVVSQISKSFDLDLSKINKINLMTATEEELHNQIYLRRYKNKIINARNLGEDPLKVIPKSDAKYQFIIHYLIK